MEKVAFITGANRGIGFETSKRLAETGVKVILGSRDLNKGKEALKKLSNLGIEADLVQFDAFDQDAPKKIYDYISKKYKKLDILINNAAVMACPQMPTKEGWDLQFAVNHIGRYD